ncbi:cobalamin biosynthesis protein, partial [Clostridium saudiense]|nr:cobalamin biosynthesis protein [Clostridium saudiense]
MKVKLDIVTGFLGSGKSVFINNIIKETITKDEKVVVLQLEDGETKISTDFVNVSTIMYNDEIYKLGSYIRNIVEENNCTRIIIEYNGTESFEELKDTLSTNN